ncbi:hypothetical protein Droror1_Dr00016087 [Drosera rotundifolia]
MRRRSNQKGPNWDRNWGTRRRWMRSCGHNIRHTIGRDRREERDVIGDGDGETVAATIGPWWRRRWARLEAAGRRWGWNGDEVRVLGYDEEWNKKWVARCVWFVGWIATELGNNKKNWAGPMGKWGKKKKQWVGPNQHGFAWAFFSMGIGPCDVLDLAGLVLKEISWFNMK